MGSKGYGRSCGEEMREEWGERGRGRGRMERREGKEKRVDGKRGGTKEPGVLVCPRWSTPL